MNEVLIILSVAAMVAYVCRLSLLHWSLHRARYILVHIVLGACASWSLRMAAEGRVSALSVALLIAALTWVALTYRTWSRGVPPEAIKARRPAGR
jgi:hypothetical protein